MSIRLWKLIRKPISKVIFFGGDILDKIYCFCYCIEEVLDQSIVTQDQFMDIMLEKMGNVDRLGEKIDKIDDLVMKVNKLEFKMDLLLKAVDKNNKS